MLKRAALILAAAALLGGLPTTSAAAGTRPNAFFDRITQVSQTGATFDARADTGGEGVFEYEFKLCPASDCRPETTITTPRGDRLGEEGDPLQPFSERVEGLQAGTRYQVTLRVGNDTYNLEDPDAIPTQVTRTFDTLAFGTIVPTQAATDAATGVSADAATLNGAVVPGTTGGSGPTAWWFEWGPAGAEPTTRTPQQTVPAGGSAVAVSASISGLTPGRSYVFRLVAERAGSTVRAGTRQFSTATTSCPAGSEHRTLSVRLARASGCFRASGARFTSVGEVVLNGLTLMPGPSASVTVDPGDRTLTASGNWRLGTRQLPDLYRGPLDFLQGGGPLLQLGADRGVALFGFPIAGEFTFTPNDDGGGALRVLLAMPVAFGGVTGESTVGVTPGGDLRLDGLRVEVGEVNLGGVFALGNLAFRYDRASDLWRGAARFALPTQSTVRVGVSVTVARGRFNEFTGSVQGINRHVAKGVFLQNIDVLFGLDPFRLGGTLGLSAGPLAGDSRILGLDGGFTFVDGSQRDGLPYPPSLEVRGDFSIVELSLAEARAKFYFWSFPWFELEGRAGLEIKSGDLTVFGLTGAVGGSLFQDEVEVTGEVIATIFGTDVAGALGLVNNQGAAACGFLGRFSIGGYYRWNGDRGRFDPCSFAALRSAVGARAAQAGTVRLGGRRQGAIRLSGAGAPPEVRLTGPGGRTLEMPAAGTHVGGGDDRYLIVRDPVSASTWVLIDDPGTAPWRYELLPGSAAVRAVATADSLPAPRLRVRVRREGRSAVLRWRLRSIPGQRVTLTEQGRGVPARVILRTNRARGTRRYVPLTVPQRRRTIVATFEQRGVPRERRVVARYVAPAPPEVRRVRSLSARRRGGRAIVRWRRQAAASRYDVLVVRRDGSRELRRTKRPRIVVRGARSLRRVTVRAVGPDGRPGAPATVSRRRFT